MANDRKPSTFDLIVADALAQLGDKVTVHRWEDPPDRDFLARLGPEAAAGYLQLRDFKLATRRCEHNPDGPEACPDCAEGVAAAMAAKERRGLA